MVATSKKSYFQVITHLLTTGADDLTLWLSSEHQWLAGGYDLEIGHFQR